MQQDLSRANNFVAGSTHVSSLTYAPALDGIRALAVFMVLYSHFWTNDTAIGVYGVRIFFMLSGYLITRMLIECRLAKQSGVTLPFYRNFLIRRSLRLLPAYYLLLLALTLFNAEGIRAFLAWHALHASNLLFAIKGAYLPWITAHYWTLSTEEQFYLFWPLIIIFAPTMLSIGCAIYATIAIGILFRLIAPLLGAGEYFIWHFPLASLDALGAGALLALLKSRRANLTWLAPIGIISGVCCIWLISVPHGLSSAVDWLILPIFLWQLNAAVSDSPPFQFRPVMWAPIVFLGKISYGIYLYHVAVVAVILKVSSRGLLTDLPRGPLLFAIATLCTIIVATLSWYVLEKPIQRYKARFPLFER